MKLKKIACAVALLGAGSTFIVPAALAAPATAESAFYVGGSVGQTKYKTPPTGDVTNFDDKDTGYKVYGGYQINQYFGVEATYFDLGKFKVDGTNPVDGPFAGSLKASAYGLAGVFTAPISNGFSVFGKLGLVRNELKVSVTNYSSKESKTGANFGFGAKYDFTPNLAVRAEWERLNKFDNRDADLKTDIDFLSTGITFKF